MGSNLRTSNFIKNQNTKELKKVNNNKTMEIGGFGAKNIQN